MQAAVLEPLKTLGELVQLGRFQTSLGLSGHSVVSLINKAVSSANDRAESIESAAGKGDGVDVSVANVIRSWHGCC